MLFSSMYFFSDMAVGLGLMFGFSFKENFDLPNLSTSITEFWRRWHISLGSWSKLYVYIPLGGNRKDARRRYKSFRSVPPYGHLAWSELEFCAMGFVARLFRSVGKMKTIKNPYQSASCCAPVRHTRGIVGWVLSRTESVSLTLVICNR